MSDPILWAWSEARDRAAFAAIFAELPGRLRRDPYRAGLLPPDHWKALLDFPLPLPREFWVAEAGGRPVGRAGASLSLSSARSGYLGFFEADVEHPERDAVAWALLDAASAWLRTRGARKVYGPVDLATWFSYRFRVPVEASTDDEDEAPFAWEPVNPPEYVRWFAAHGFTEAERYHSLGFRIHDPAMVDRLVKATGIAYNEAREKGFTFRPFEPGRSETDLSVLYSLSMEAFREHLLFEPIPSEVFRTLYAPVAARPDKHLVYCALDPHGRGAGFVFAFIDRGYTVLKTIAVRPRFRGQNFSTALLHLVFGDMAARGSRQFISALVKMGGTSDSVAARHERVFGVRRGWSHAYALFEQSS